MKRFPVRFRRRAWGKGLVITKFWGGVRGLENRFSLHERCDKGLRQERPKSEASSDANRASRSVSPASVYELRRGPVKAEL